MFYADYHMHTTFSSDSDAPMKSMIEKAIQCQLKEIAITDHLDLQYPSTEFPFTLDTANYIKAIHAYQKEYQNQITIRLGVELGLWPSLSHEYAAFVQENPFDFVIGSIHCVDGLELYGNEFFKGKTKEEAFGQYFDTVLWTAKNNDFFDVYGHIDYIDRYSRYDNNTIDYAYFQDIIDEILKTLIEKGKGIEINTSGYKYGLGHAHPAMPMLKRYRELGGEILTIGSDAHDPRYITNAFSESYRMAREAGFKSLTVFEKHKPTFIDIFD